MRRHFAVWRAIAVSLPFCLLSLAAAGQGVDPKQALCQASWDRCLTTVEGGKNWKPLYDRCLKSRSICLAGRAYVPALPAGFPSTSIAVLGQESGSGSDPANADLSTRAALCEKGQTRGDKSSCTLAAAGDGYGQSFSLVGPGVPLSRIQRVSSIVKCAGASVAMFYPNGRIESCMLDNSGTIGISLTDSSGKVITCAAHAIARFDPEGRVSYCN
jgi:hypothetical protein